MHPITDEYGLYHHDHCPVPEKGCFMTAHVRRFIVSLLALGWLLSIIVPSVEASCGSVSCFVVIGSQQQVPMAGLLTVNAIYNYTPLESPLGQGGSIPFANQENQTLTLANLNASQIRTLVRTATLDMNYGLTERFGLQVSIPYKQVNSDAQIGGLNPIPYSDKGLGDIRVALKYNVLPTLRTMVVLGLGVDLPTGDYGQRVQGGSLAESTLQIGRGNFGLVPTLYQSYELIPHRLNQFALASYRHTYKNSDGYKFGDEVNLSAGLNIIPLEQTP
ncbi:MAG: transporter, partial [Nitrospirota bacterium]